MAQAPVRVGIYGASGYAGQDTVEILASHPCAEIVFATSNTYQGDAVPFTSLTYTPHDDAPLDSVDVVFLALPHTASATVAAKALDLGKRVVDLSADFRLEDPTIYESWYKVTHPHPELLPVPYGLVEVNREALRGLNLVAVPGCYPTTTLLGLYPLLKVDALRPEMPIIVDAKSGVSGAGRGLKPHLHFVEAYSNFSPYAPGRSHRHVGEIEQFIHKYTSEAGPMIFTPHLLPVDRGLMASIYVHLKDDFNADDAQALFETTYAGESLVDVLPAGEQATIKHVVRTNKCVISVTPVADKYLHITSVTDNLRKGAAGQAVQNFNLMMGFEETMALL